ncbi:MAG TPA: universal stress protein [Thermoplasmata archaeon]|nr:universal stress protein [Thermoplasmata archaeon]
MYRQILIPVSEPSEVEPLIRFGAMLLDPDGEIRVLHIIPTTTLPQVTREWRSSVNLVVPAHEAGAALDVRVDPEVRASTDVPGEILESAESHGVDAILMTLRGDKRSRNPFVGHTASGILHHAHADVLIVNRLALTAGKLPRILLPSFRSTPLPRAMQVAEEIAVHNEGAPVTTLALGPRAPGEAEEIPDREERTSRGVVVTHKRTTLAGGFVRRARLPGVILQAAQRERFGLLLVGEEGDLAGGALLTRPFLEDLFRAAPCPVLALRS